MSEQPRSQRRRDTVASRHRFSRINLPMIPIAASIVADVAFLWTGLAALAISEDSQNAGRCASEAGTLIVRQAGQRAWHAAKSGEQLAAGDLVVGFPGAAIDSEKGAVRLT